MKKSYFIAVAIGLPLLLNSCKDVVLTPEHIDPLYKMMADFNKLSPVEQDSVIQTDSIEIYLLMKFLGHDFVWEKTTDTLPEAMNDHIFSRKEYKILEEERKKEAEIPTIRQLLEEWPETQVARIYTPDVDSVYPNLDDVENSLGLILANAKEIGLDIPKRRYAAVVWSSKRNILMTDSVMFIALNHFLGEDYKGYNSWEQYLRKTKTPVNLAYNIAEALVENRYPFERDENSTALSRMMYEGAVVYVMLKIVPYATLANTLGYTTDELQWLDRHYQEMWETIIGKDLLYSTSREAKSRLVNPAPSTSILSPEAPGRAGRYLGYRIVFNYMENNAKTPVTHLLSPEFYDNPSELVLSQ